MNSREQFEALIKPLWHLETCKGSDDSLQYRDEVIQGKWEAWQAASKASEQQLTESRREFTAANATIHNLELSKAELAAELSAIEAIHNDAVFITDEHYEQCPPEVQKIIGSLAVLKIPAYDAYLAEVLAQGVDAAIEQLHKKFEGTGHIGVPVMVLESFAAQLRQGAEK
ncbi:hypothetical protein [Kluyvera sichuanensis]|uniref:hypothetical protein n=1 Tax=Kluyvera sichuanensis TaxID=2725494 RepID=UPI0039F4CCC5